MWMINDDGFFSAVQDWDNSDWLFVRSRSETDLEAFSASAFRILDTEEWDSQIVHTPSRDYQWRIHTPKHVWSGYLAGKASEISYGNFKNHCAQQWRQEERDWVNERLSVLNDAWMLFNHWPNGELFDN